MSTAIISIGQYSSRGAKEENQDSYGVLVPDEPALSYKGIVAVVADGVSGCDGGKIASESCVKSLMSDYYCTADSWTVKTSISKVLLATNRWLHGQGLSSRDMQRGLATTMSALVIKSATAHMFHIGDTRIYHLRGDKFECLTQDHRVWVSADKNYLTRALGIDLKLDIDYMNFLVEPGDLFVFTTDGVHEFVPDAALRDLVLRSGDDLDEGARNITDLALHNGSQDNLSCQILRINQLPGADEQEVYRKLTELPIPPSLSPGMKMDGYRVVREIHASKRSQVYLAVDEETGQQVVLKTPSVNYEDDPLYLDLFLHEEWIGKRVQSQHLLAVVNQTRPKQFLYSVSEYVEGQTLRSWMHDNGAAELSDIRDIVGQIARGLHVLHKMEMIHQDLKPENIMIDRHGTVKIIDFGSVKIAGIEEVTTPVKRLTLLGTKNYTAPEYLLGYPCTPRSDIFSLAVIVYEMITGHLPYGEGYSESTINKLGYVSARDYYADLPVWIDKALEKALRKNPQRRYSELSEFVYDLSNPNNELLQEYTEPLLARNPIGFWRGVALCALLLNVILIIKLFGN